MPARVAPLGERPHPTGVSRYPIERIERGEHARPPAVVIRQ
jgi:hypothetical protein